MKTESIILRMVLGTLCFCTEYIQMYYLLALAVALYRKVESHGLWIQSGLQQLLQTTYYCNTTVSSYLCVVHGCCGASGQRQQVAKELTTSQTENLCFRKVLLTYSFWLAEITSKLLHPSRHFNVSLDGISHKSAPLLWQIFNQMEGQL